MIIAIKTKEDFINASEVDILASNIFKSYTEELNNNNFRLFAKQVDFKLKRVDFYELSAFKSKFKKHFKTIKQLRKTKDIKSDFLNIDLYDYYDNKYTVYFVVDKKEYQKNGVKYLDSVFNEFLLNISEALNKK